jgi:hypothetical protein
MATEAPPAAPSAPAAPSSPSPAPTPSGGGGDVLDSLRSEAIAWGHRGTPAEPDAPAPADASGTTPETPAEGSTPPTDAPAPAQTSAHESWVKRYGDPEKAATEAYALEQRAAAMAKELKDLKAAQPSSPASPPPAAAQPAAAPPATAPQAQPAQPTQPAPSLEDQALRFALKHDEQCRGFLDQFNANEAALKVLIDPKSGTGEIPTLEAEVRKAQTLIDHPSVDELVKDEARQLLLNARSNLAAKKAEAAALRLSNKELDIDFRSRIDGYVGQLEGQVQERAREAKDEQDAEAKAQEFVGHWPAAFETAFKETFKDQDVDPKLRSDIHEAVKEKALARPGRIDLKDLTSFMQESIKSEHQKLDRYHREQARLYAVRKNADTSPAAPTGAAAQASPAAPTTEDPDRVTRNMLRDAIKARKGLSIR